MPPPKRVRLSSGASLSSSSSTSSASAEASSSLSFRAPTLDDVSTPPTLRFKNNELSTIDRNRRWRGLDGFVAAEQAGVQEFLRRRARANRRAARASSETIVTASSTSPSTVSTAIDISDNSSTSLPITFASLATSADHRRAIHLSDISGELAPYTCPRTRLHYANAAEFARIGALAPTGAEALLKLRSVGHAL